MKADGSNAGDKVTKQATGKTDVAVKPSFKDWMMSKAESFRSLIPSGTVDPDRFIKAGIIEITSNPKLMACTRDSIVMAIGQCARYGLEPGSLLGQAWLIPYNENKLIDGKWHKIPSCKFQLGYKGLIALARRSNTIQTISAEPVYQGDVDSGRFLVELGTERRLIHKPDFFSDRGEIIGYYAAVKLVNGETQFAIMSRKDVEKHRDRFSKLVEKKKDDQEGKYKTKETVWDSDFDSMALKTVIIKTLKLCPISIEAMEAINREEAEESGNPIPPPDDKDIYAGDYEVMPADGEAESDHPEEPAPDNAAKQPESPQQQPGQAKPAAQPSKSNDDDDALIAQHESELDGIYQS